MILCVLHVLDFNKMQSFLTSPNFNKNFFYKKPIDLYQEFSNAYAYYKQATHSNTSPNRQELLREARAAWKQIKSQDKAIIREQIKTYFTTLPHIIRSYQSLVVSAPIASESAFSVTETSSWISNKTNIVAKNAIRQ